MHSGTRLLSNSRAGRNHQHDRRRLPKNWRAATNTFESLEPRALLTADIAIANFSADGSHLLVDYDITGASVAAFNIAIYRSSNGTSLDTLLQTQRITSSGDLQVGTGHRATISASFGDIDTDYYLVAVVDSSGEIGESSELNNQLKFAGGVFLASNGLLHVHGLDTGEYIIVGESTTFDVTLNGTVYSNSTSSVTGVRIRSHDGSDFVIGGSTSKPELICGGNGDDVLIGSGGNDLLRGGNGNDLQYGYGGNDVLYGEAGNDLLDSGDGNDQLTGSSGNDSLWGGNGDDAYYFSGSGNLGTDDLHEAADEGTWDWLHFSGLGAGITLDLNSTSLQTVATGLLSLTLSNSSGIEAISDTSYADTINGNGRNNSFWLTGGDDDVEGRGGNDIYWYAFNVNHEHDTLKEEAGGGNDSINFAYLNLDDDDSSGGITLDMGSSALQSVASVTIGGVTTSRLQLTLVNPSQFETATGSNYNDTIYGSDSTSTLNGLGGNDSLHGGNVATTGYLYGGDGNDSLYGGSGNDALYGEAGDDTISAAAGNDLLEGGAGNDGLDGGAGNDTYRFWGSSNLGADTISEAASNGTDLLDFSGLSQGFALDLSWVNVSQPVGYNLYLNLSNANAIENVTGNNDVNYITGNDLNNVIYGLGGNDQIEVAAGNDIVYGGDGNDTILGGSNNDLVYGGAGNDVIYGNTGDCVCPGDADTLYGEGGEDWLYGDGDNDYLNGGAGLDTYDTGGQPGDTIAGHPTITDVQVDFDGNMFHVYGHVDDDESVDGLTVYFGGALSGQSTTVDEDGYFELYVPADDWGDGSATATVWDWEGLQSEVEDFDI
ncbi:MAG: hypothetical protein IT427_07200 [Pirellulales bacterium]|nr:hypothetical protein [Pirellulales bacterium]